MKTIKTIRSKILLPIILLVSISLALLGGVSIYLNIASTNSTLKQTMSETVKIGAERVSQELQRYMSIAAETGTLVRIASTDSTLEAKKELLDQKVKTYGFQRGEIIMPDGSSLISGNNYADRDYFKASMAGETYVSDPLVSKITGELTIIVSAPLWKDGIAGSSVVGVVYFVPKETFLNDIVESMQVSSHGSSYMLNKSGITIAHTNMELVKTQSNTSEDVKTDASLKPLAELEGRMTKGEAGFGTYKYGGANKFLAYAPIPESNGWSLAINAPKADFMAEAYMSIYLTIGLVVFSLAVAVAVAVSLASRISRPVKEVQKAAAQLAEGNLSINIQSDQCDEVGQMTNSFASASRMMREYIRDIDRGLHEIANGNLDIRPETDFKGDFKTIEASIFMIITSLSDALSQINQASDQVSSGSDQVSSGAQALSQGATEQASSIEELAATINEISEQVKKTAEGAELANVRVSDVAGEIAASNEKMRRLIDAMGDITQKSGEIGKIIKTIDDIAFQTNILALNAAVEAARAGTAGKGFAVVADEVRSLASKSAEAAKNTTSLIEGTIRAVENGTKLADETAHSLSKVVEGNKEVVSIIDLIDKATDEQAQSIAQVTTGVDQISAVVQTNSATAEESAAASEELSGQASMLKELIGHFKLQGSGGVGSPVQPPVKPQESSTVSSFKPTPMGGKY